MKENKVDDVTLVMPLKLAIKLDIAVGEIEASLVIVPLAESDESTDKLLNDDGVGNNAVIDTDGEVIPVIVTFKDRLIRLLDVATMLLVPAAVTDGAVLKDTEGTVDRDTVRDIRGEPLVDTEAESVTEIVVSTEVVNDVRGVVLDDDDGVTDFEMTDEVVCEAEPLENNDRVGIAELIEERDENIEGVLIDVLLNDRRDVIDRLDVNDARKDGRDVEVGLDDADV